jgi:hypothetical protein
MELNNSVQLNTFEKADRIMQLWQPQKETASPENKKRQLHNGVSGFVATDAARGFDIVEELTLGPTGDFSAADGRVQVGAFEARRKGGRLFVCGTVVLGVLAGLEAGPSLTFIFVVPIFRWSRIGVLFTVNEFSDGRLNAAEGRWV